MRFTKEQYIKAKQNLNLGRCQLDLHSDGNRNKCLICHDSGHMAWECGSNPLLAWALCNEIAKRADELHEKLHKDCLCSTNDEETNCPTCTGSVGEIHEFLHYLSGHNTWMGELVGPRKMRPIENP